MTAYHLLKFVHVAAAIVWVGGVITLTVVTRRMARVHGGPIAQALAREQPFFGQRLMMPAALTTLLSGLAMVGLLGGRPPFWVVWGLAGVFGSSAIGALLGRTGQELGRLSAAGTEEARLRGLRRRLAVLAGINIAVLLSTVWAMVVKPTL
ncbi:MAG TPA: DUF2269 family protein [Longimicrobiales bacterium]